MTQLSDYLEAAWMNTLKGVSFTALSNLYLGLHTAAGADESTAAWRTTEVGAVGSYARAQVASAGWTGPTVSAGGNVLTNAADITFVAATANWGTLTHWTVWDGSSLSTANLLYYQVLPAAKVINTGDVGKFTAGNLAIGLQ